MPSARRSPAVPPLPAGSASYPFVGERLWLDFVNSDDAADALASFGRFVGWLSAARVLDEDRATAMVRRAQQQPTGSSAALHEARRLRNVLRALAERGDASHERTTQTAVIEINRVLGRSSVTRRLEPRPEGGFSRNFVTAGDAFAGLMIPIIESVADALVSGELGRVRRCADPRCARVFYDGSRNRKRRWCDMRTCGNRAKAARHRRKLRG
jgi:predicted RNA-binding Zn ribbon-like protein